MRIDIWSDVVCPWCAIGKARLDRALADFAHRDQVEVVYRSYLLDPSAPTEPTMTTGEMLQRKYRMGPAQAADAQARVRTLAAEEGMDWDNDAAPYVATGDAHRLLHLARASGRQVALKEALWAAYFGRARNIADHAVLREIADAVGLDVARVDRVLGSREYEEDVEADIAQAASYGATGVPLFVVDERYGVSGAQPAETFTRVLEQAWADRHPSLETVPGATDAEACGPDGCPV